MQEIVDFTRGTQVTTVLPKVVYADFLRDALLNLSPEQVNGAPGLWWRDRSLRSGFGWMEPVLRGVSQPCSECL